MREGEQKKTTKLRNENNMFEIEIKLLNYFKFFRVDYNMKLMTHYEGTSIQVKLNYFILGFSFSKKKRKNSIIT